MRSDIKKWPNAASEDEDEDNEDEDEDKLP